MISGWSLGSLVTLTIDYNVQVYIRFTYVHYIYTYSQSFITNVSSHGGVPLKPRKCFAKVKN